MRRSPCPRRSRPARSNRLRSRSRASRGVTVANEPARVERLHRLHRRCAVCLAWISAVEPSGAPVPDASPEVAPGGGTPRPTRPRGRGRSRRRRSDGRRSRACGGSPHASAADRAPIASAAGAESTDASSGHRTRRNRPYRGQYRPPAPIAEPTGTGACALPSRRERDRRRPGGHREPRARRGGGWRWRRSSRCAGRPTAGRGPVCWCRRRARPSATSAAAASKVTSPTWRAS